MKQPMIAVDPLANAALLQADLLDDVGAAFGAAFFIGREHAQAEERYIEANGGRRYHTPVAPEWAVFNLRWWDRDALLDWITPTTAVVAVALLSMCW